MSETVSNSETQALRDEVSRLKEKITQWETAFNNMGAAFNATTDELHALCVAVLGVDPDTSEELDLAMERAKSQSAELSTLRQQNAALTAARDTALQAAQSAEDWGTLNNTVAALTAEVEGLRGDKAALIDTVSAYECRCEQLGLKCSRCAALDGAGTSPLLVERNEMAKALLDADTMFYTLTMEFCHIDPVAIGFCEAEMRNIRKILKGDLLQIAQAAVAAESAAIDAAIAQEKP